MRPGGSLRLHCPVTGSPPFKVEWYRDEERIDPEGWGGSRQYSLSGRGDRNIKIRKVGHEQAGIYTCKVFILIKFVITRLDN